MACGKLLRLGLASEPAADHDASQLTDQLTVILAVPADAATVYAVIQSAVALAAINCIVATYRVQQLREGVRVGSYFHTHSIICIDKNKSLSLRSRSRIILKPLKNEGNYIFLSV